MLTLEVTDFVIDIDGVIDAVTDGVTEGVGLNGISGTLTLISIVKVTSAPGS